MTDMNIRITLQYHTHWGQSLVLRIGKRKYPMDPAYASMWQKELTGRNLKDGDSYTFEVEQGGKVVRREWRAHRFDAPQRTEELVIRDRWNERPADSTFYAAAFSDVIFRRPDGVSFRNPRPTASWMGNVAFRVAVPQVRTGESVAIAGSGPLGDWKVFHLLDDGCFPYWRIALDVKESFEYKFVIVDTETRQPVVWEEGANHFFAEVPAAGCHLEIADAAPVFRTRHWRGAGVAVPVFSLRTEDSFGSCRSTIRR